jgi:homospermidine synthase
MPDKTDEKQGKFRKGRSGNPLGRPRGIRNKASLLAKALFEGEIEGICRKAIEEAKQGNMQAIKLILDRILPPKKEAPILIDLPVMKTGSDILEAVHRVAVAICDGKISPSEGELLTRIIDRQAKAIELNEFELRLKNLEERQRNNEKSQ